MTSPEPIGELVPFPSRRPAPRLERAAYVAGYVLAATVLALLALGLAVTVLRSLVYALELVLELL